ncbi:hypothetical protein [Pseudacidovorax sp. RU35E]|uniref:hypothetical protein n=1 Tax=Pseudacidovorax sp. RU35E TaxID=1907403 RepID=UPI00117A3CF8|nr:hypothetical protein [Pseudacidovorax sp. RU35E]
MALIYLFDQRIGDWSAVNAAGFIAFCIALFFLKATSERTGKVKKNWIYLLLAIIAYSSTAYLLNDQCSVELKGALSLTLLCIAFYILGDGNFGEFVRSRFFSNFVMLLASSFVILNYVGITPFRSDRNSGLFFEASHLAIYLLPFLAYRHLKSKKDLITWMTTLIMLVFSSSTTLIVGLLIIFVIKFIKRYNRRLIIASSAAALIVGALIGILLSGAIDAPELRARVINLFIGGDASAADHENLSSLVWLNGWSQMTETLRLTNGIGLGFNQMGCGNFMYVGKYTALISDAILGIILNAEDGSFMSSKLVSELGFLGFLIIAFLLIKAWRALFKFIRVEAGMRQPDTYDVLIRASGAICLIGLLFVRAPGSYFSLPVYAAMSMLFSNQLIRSNRIRKNSESSPT